jgi:hypothetical protein
VRRAVLPKTIPTAPAKDAVEIINPARMSYDKSAPRLFNPSVSSSHTQPSLEAPPPVPPAARRPQVKK